MFLEKSDENRLIQIDNKKDAITKLLECMIRPLVTKEWWEKMLTLAEKMANEVPCYTLQFDKSGGVVNLLEKEFGVKVTVSGLRVACFGLRIERVE